MRLTGLIVNCKHCTKEFEVFSDDAAHDTTACWNWCPHCGKKNNLWIRWKDKHNPLDKNVLIGLTHKEAVDKFVNEENKK